MNGGYGALTKEKPYLNQVFDRYGNAFNIAEDGTPNLGGTFTSEVKNGNPLDFGSRALNMKEKEYDFYYQIIIKDPSKFEIESSRIVPWFGEKGNGFQTQFKILDMDQATGHPKTWTKLAEEGAIELKIVKSPSGKYSSWVGSGKTISSSIKNSVVDLVKDLSTIITDSNLVSKIDKYTKQLKLSNEEMKLLIKDIKENDKLKKIISDNPENGIDIWNIFKSKNKPFCK